LEIANKRFDAEQSQIDEQKMIGAKSQKIAQGIESVSLNEGK